jgi:hypothetical protein
VVGEPCAFVRDLISLIFQEGSEAHLRSAVRFDDRSYVLVDGP